MKSIALAAAVIACLVLATVAPPVEAATTWTAKIGTSYGSAKVVKGTSTRLTIAARKFRARTTYAVSLRRGGCSSFGTLITSRRMTTSRYGAISTTLTLTTAQARLVRLPMAIRVGSRCGIFKLPAPVATPTPIPPGTFGDGTYRVGTTVQPGTYRAANTSSCYWARLSGFGGTLDEIITNDIGRGPRIVTISPTDVGFTSSGCGTWKLQPEAVAPVPAGTFGEGVWRVNVDVLPGTYQSTSTSSCYWARLSGFGGTLDEIITNDIGTGSRIVTISPTDAGVTTSSCGAWTLLP